MTDFREWQFDSLVKFCQDATAALKEKDQEIKALLDAWRAEIKRNE